MVFFEEEKMDPNPDRIIWQLARIALEVRRTKSKKSLRLIDFIPKFLRPKKKPVTEAEIRQHVATSKNYWKYVAQNPQKPRYRKDV